MARIPRITVPRVNPKPVDGAPVRNGGAGGATSGLPWCDGDIDRQPRRDAPKQGNKVFWLTGRIWVEEEATELFIHSHPNRDGSWTEGEFVKCRVLMLHDPDRQIMEVAGLSGTQRWNDRPIPITNTGDLYGLPEAAMKRFKVIAAPPKLYHAAHKDNAEHIARHGITPGDYAKGSHYVWASQTPNRAVRAFLAAVPAPASDVEVYEIDMTGIPTVLREHGYEGVAMFEAIADFFDAPHVRAMAKKAAGNASGLGFYEDSRIIEGAVPLSRIKKLPK